MSVVANYRINVTYNNIMGYNRQDSLPQVYPLIKRMAYSNVSYRLPILILIQTTF